MRILARTSRGDFLRYEPAVCGITINFPAPLKEPSQLDLAFLRPAVPRSGVEHLNVSHERWPAVGTRVLMAGFPDELEAPLLWTKAINYEYPPIKETTEQNKRNVERINQLLMIKRGGMIGHLSDLSVDPDGSGKKTLEVGAYYIDNAMHSGSSGGPVVDERGLVVGTITRRAVTTIPIVELENPNKEVPSGSALAVSTFTLMEYVALWT